MPSLQYLMDTWQKLYWHEYFPLNLQGDTVASPVLCSAVSPVSLFPSELSHDSFKTAATLFSRQPVRVGQAFSLSRGRQAWQQLKKAFLRDDGVLLVLLGSVQMLLLNVNCHYSMVYFSGEKKGAVFTTLIASQIHAERLGQSLCE